MMEHNTEKLLSAIGDVDAAYLEEALDFDAANAGRKRAARFPKLSAACVITCHDNFHFFVRLLDFL